MKLPVNIAVMGGGSWATALAKMLLGNCDRITWYMRREDRIEAFQRLGHNPAYLTDVIFDTTRIDFTTDINEACERADVLLFATPSPYFKSHVDKITVDISSKWVISAIKGVVPDDNITVSEYMEKRFAIDPLHTMAISGPCHAEEIALGRRSYLTVACRDEEAAETLASLLTGKTVSATTSTDITGIEFAAVLKNVYAIAAGIIHGLKMGDNFLAVTVSNAIREMDRFLNAISPRERDICRSVYLGDLLVTSYSRFSRNHNFGSMIGKGYSVKAAIMEMEQTAEGYFGTRCISEINRTLGVDMPLAAGVYDIIYRNARPETVMRRVALTFN